MSDVFQEVQEEYRRQQIAKLWEKYRVPIIGGASALIIAVAGYQGWTYWHGLQVEKSSREFDAIGELISGGQAKDAADRLAKLAAGGSAGYQIAAKLQEAALRAELGDKKAALALFDKIADSASDALVRDYALLRGALLIADNEKYETLKSRLEPLAQAGRPWRAIAMELLAYTTWRAGKKDEALKLYAETQALQGVPDSVKRRAIEMTSLIQAGMTLGDLKTSASGAATNPLALPPPGGDGPLLLAPTTPQPAAPEPPSLLGPVAPAAPAPTTPTTPSP